MRKYGKVLAAVMVMAMLMASVMGVSAAKSSTSDVTVSGDSSSKYDVAADADAFKEFETSNQAMYNKFVGYNDGTVKLDALIEGASDEVKKELEGKTAITKLYDLVKVTTDPVSGKHKVTLTVPTLTDKAEDVVVLHYNDGAWEIVKPVVSGKTVTVELDNLGVFGIYASLKSDESAKTGGTNSTWMVVVALAVVAAGAVVIASQKKRG